jgi:predicted glycogen debranching enzyme
VNPRRTKLASAVPHAGDERAAPDATVRPLVLGREACGDWSVASRREWLVTNGLGGYASGTVAGAVTRRYHGLLVAARRPPVERTVTLVKLEAVLTVDGRRVELGANEYTDGTVHPRGFEFLESFRLDGTVPVWTYAIGTVRLECRVFMAHGRNTTYVEYRLVDAPAPVAIELTPLCAWRDYHWQQHGGAALSVSPVDGGCEVHGGDGAFRVLASDAAFELGPCWHWHVAHAIERERGLGDGEDLLQPGRFGATLAPGASLTVIATTEAESPPTASSVLAAARRREASLLGRVSPQWPDVRKRLVLAADAYVVARGERGSTVIAGYPWFTDWGRDTMIALPGLALSTGRADVAGEILRTFAAHVRDGLLPNRFPDGTEAPEYNTVDATLWYFQAIGAWFAAARDVRTLANLYPVLVGIVAHHDAGTHFGIGVDPSDGLLRAGEPGVQLTWMDARVDGRVITPRTGKPVEINALWHGALAHLADFADVLGRRDEAGALRARAASVARSFVERFWSESHGHLYDVVDVPGSDAPDASLRPNQLIACSLRHPLLDRERTRRIVDVCGRELLTTYGLRSLSPRDADYVPHYAGGPAQRDAAYHQGTVWTWLLGPYVRAHLRAYGDAAAMQRVVEAAAQSLRADCLGQVGEIFDAEPPHRPAGCFAQAWSVAELLTAWDAIDAYAAPNPATSIDTEVNA